ncbi:hypothetical protein E2562_020553 [Oryza meyeriana var. granulata]|uniref:Uncharacterized protein n=1 Tax=Oryza meyeriana var. granulata TaxID=110450 RepID=A0A6G1EA02_9ORYZ|nr:hypothetical protein E2562_020553 [Oryza meyeriana var. granulata]
MPLLLPWVIVISPSPPPPDLEGVGSMSVNLGIGLGRSSSAEESGSGGVGGTVAETGPPVAPTVKLWRGWQKGPVEGSTGDGEDRMAVVLLRGR